MDDDQQKMNSVESLTFSNDNFNRIQFAQHLNLLIQASGIFKENGSFSIAIDASWGMGKTQFLHMWRHMLEKMECPFHSDIIYYNAWENDSARDALIPLTYHIGKDHVIQKQNDEQALAFMQRLLKAGVKSTIKVASMIFPVVSVLQEMSEMALDEMAGNHVKDAMEMYQDSLLARKELYTVIREMAGDKKLIIMIDELDRCRPSFAVKTLEAVKHFLDIPNVVFVFALDLKQLSKSIATIYGQDMDASGYLARFFDYTTQLTCPAAVQYLRCLPNGVYPEDSESLELLDETVRLLALSARETIMLLRLFHAFNELLEQGPQAVYARRFFFLMMAVKSKAPSLYCSMIGGDDGPLKIVRLYSEGRRAPAYLDFAVEIARIPAYAAEVTLDRIAKTKLQKRPGDPVRLSLAKYFVGHALANYPEEKPFGTILQERMEVFSVPMHQNLSI